MRHCMACDSGGRYSNTHGNSHSLSLGMESHACSKTMKAALLLPGKQETWIGNKLLLEDQASAPKKKETNGAFTTPGRW